MNGSYGKWPPMPMHSVGARHGSKERRGKRGYQCFRGSIRTMLLCGKRGATKGVLDVVRRCGIGPLTTSPSV